MRSTKKLIGILTASILVVILLAGFLVLFILVKKANNAITIGDMDDAKTAGQNAGSEYRKHLDELLEQMQDRIDNAESQNPIDGFEQRYNDLVNSIKGQMADQEANLGELANSKLETMTAMRGSFASLKTLLETELADLLIQLADINESIAGLEALEGDHSSALAGFYFVKTTTETNIAAHESNITQLTNQITELDNLIALCADAAHKG